MLDITPNLALPEIVAAQAQKHITHNEALRALDTLVQLAVLDRDLAAPPGAPVDGQRWLVAAAASGAWAGHDGAIAVWQGGAWEFHVPKPGWLAYVVDEGALIAWTGSAWVDAITALTSLNNMTLLGVGTTADATNPFSAKLNNTLWLAKTVAEGGDGDLRYKLSKESAANTLSFLFQDNFSGRAEIGLTGDDDFHFKVSADGSAWNEAMLLDKTTGVANFPSGAALGLIPYGRPTLSSFTPFMTANVTAATVIYYTPFGGNTVPVYNGSVFVLRPLLTEIALNLDGNVAHGGYHQVAKNFHLFLAWDNGTLRLGSGPAWASDSSEGVGAGTTETELYQGLWVNKNAITLRHGANSGDTLSVPARQATCVGSFRASADGQCEFTQIPAPAAGGTNNKLFLYSNYHQACFLPVCIDSTASWTYATPAFRSINNSASNRISVLQGLGRKPVAAHYVVTTSSTSTSYSSIAVDNTTPQGSYAQMNLGQVFSLSSRYQGDAGVGFHFLQPIEYSVGATSTYYGGAAQNQFSLQIWM